MNIKASLHNTIKQAIIPVAGKGTRFLPATKEIPKEMIPIINRPMIHYVVEEAVNSGVEEIIFITSSSKDAIVNYFKQNLELEKFLKENKKFDELKTIQKLASSDVKITTVEQKQQLGLGHAVLCAEELITDDRFVVLLGDDIILGEVPCVHQLMCISEQFENAPVIGVMAVEKSQVNKYGIVDGVQTSNPKALKMRAMVEKPSPADAPSQLATPGRYLLTREIFQCLREIKLGAGGEYQLTDAINLLAHKRNVYSYQFEGDRFDTGNVEGYLNATLEFALRDEHLRPYMLEVIREKLKTYTSISHDVRTHL